MPVGATIAAGALTAGGAIIGGKTAAKASDRAADEQAASDAAALQLQRDMYNQQREDYAPWRAVGAGALQMLARTMNVYVPPNTFSTNVAPAPSWGPAAPPAATSPTTPPAGPAFAADTFDPKAPGSRGEIIGYGPTDQPIYATDPAAPGAGGAPPAAAPQLLTPGMTAGEAYAAANPDVAAEWQHIVATGNAGNDKFKNDPEKYYLWHYQKYGAAEGRAAPMAVAATYAPVETTPTVTTPAGTTPAATTTAPPPVATDYRGNPVTAAGIPQNATAGTNSRYGDFYASPDYAFRRDEGLRAITGNYAARGLLDSGVLGKGLINYGEAAASQEFGAWYNRIASLAGVGQTAVDNSTAAGQAAINAQSGIIRDQGASRASSIATQGGINAGLISGAANAGAGLITNLAGRNGGVGGSTPVGPPATYYSPTRAPGIDASGLIPTSSSLPAGLFGPPI